MLKIVDWLIFVVIFGLALAAFLYSTQVNAGPYVGLHQSQREYNDEGQVDSWADSRGCLSCKQTVDLGSDDPLGMVLGYRAYKGPWFVDGSVWINESGEYDRASREATAHYTIQSSGLSLLFGRDLPYGFDFSVGFGPTRIDAKVHAWGESEDHYRVTETTNSLQAQASWTHSSGFGAYVRWIDQTGAVDGIGRKPMWMGGVDYRF